MLEEVRRGGEGIRGNVACLREQNCAVKDSGPVASRHDKSASVFRRQKLRVQKCSPERVEFTFSKIATNVGNKKFVIQILTRTS